MTRQLKRLTFLCIGLSLILSGCTKDDTGSKQDQILGKWFLDRYIVYSGKDNAVLDTEENTGCGKEEYFEFLPTGKCVEWSSAGPEGNCEGFSSGATDYIYEADTKKIIVTYNGGTSAESFHEYPVHSISSQELQLEGAAEDNDFDNDGHEDRFVSVYIKH